MPDLPSGTVTFLFTDIEGSTLLWERDRQAMASAVERHIALLDAAIQTHGGVHFKTVGDAVQAAFPTAPQSVAASLDAQRALLAEDWGEIGALRVRMAVHAGEAEPNERGDYLTAPLNRLARLLATGHGGQILLSQTVQQLTRGALPRQAELRDLGEHRLRDLLEPERVFQLVHPELPAEFPLLKSLETRPHNLPRQPTPFLGREREVGEVVALLRRDDVQLLTLTGPGGTGKTRLALQAAADLLEDFTDGVFFVPLAPLTDPDLVVSTIAATMGIREAGDQSLPARLQNFLEPQNVLLVLDNVEHVVEAAPGVGVLLAASPGLKVLATSRLPLHLRAEREYGVLPLALPRREPPPAPEELSQNEAIRLFIERARAVKSDFTIDNENAPAIAEICLRLDGLPLAIELAAARVRLLPPQTLVARLERRLSLLTGGARDVPARQRTLRDTIAWSCDLLDPNDETLFRRLAVFAGGCTLASAEAVANPDGTLDVFAGLERLVEHNLLRQDPQSGAESRFLMLETVREYGMERLAGSGEEAMIRTAHATHFVALAEQAERPVILPGQERWLARLAADHDNLRAVLTWSDQSGANELGLRLAGALARFWLVHGDYREGQGWLERWLAAEGGIPLTLRAKALCGLAGLAMFLGEYDRARTAYGAGVAGWRRVGAASELAFSLIGLGVTVTNQGDYHYATRLLEEALAICREMGDEPSAAPFASLALGNLGFVAIAHGEFTQATAYFEEALALQRALGYTWGACYSLRGLALLAQERGDLEQALALNRESIELAGHHREQRVIAWNLTNVGSLVGAAGHPQQAARFFGAAEALRDAIGVPLAVAWQPDHAPVVAVVRDALGEDGFAAAWAAGRNLRPEEAVAEAVHVVDEVLKGPTDSRASHRESDLPGITTRGK